MARIGLISDTHGLLRPEACAALVGCERIIHAGDIGTPDVLSALAAIAPVTAVRGNNDRGDWARRVPQGQRVRIDDVVVCVVHDLADLDVAAVASGARVVVSGHSHKADVRESNGVLYVNPGSAGPRRFRLPITIGELEIAGRVVTAHIFPLVLRDAA
jgi:putative phosphoesterase